MIIIPYSKNGANDTQTLYSYDMVNNQKIQGVKLVLGDQGVNDGFVSSSNPIPVVFSTPSLSNVTRFDSQIGSFEIMTFDHLRTGATVANQTDDVLYLLFGEGLASETSATVVVPSNAILTLTRDDFNGRVSAFGNGVGHIIVTRFTVETSMSIPNGTSLKTINGESILGTGNIVVAPISNAASMSTSVNGLNSSNVRDAISELYALISQGLLNKAGLVDGKIPSGLLPSSILGQVHYISGFDPNVALPEAAENKGGYYIAITDGADYKTGDWAVSNGSIWERIDNTDAVISIAGKTGIVTLDAVDITSGVFSPLRIPNISWSKINSDLPNTLEGYGILDGAEKATTVEGYGITNAVTKTQMNGVPGCCVDSIGNVRSMPVKVNNTANYSLVAADNGCAIVTTTSIVVPLNTLVVGDIVMIFNDTAAPITITTSAVTAYISGIDTVKTSITLTERGMCSIWFYASNKITISGDVA